MPTIADEVLRAQDHDGRVVRTLIVKTYPLSRVSDLRIIFQRVPSFIYNLGSERNPILVFCCGDLELNLNPIPREKGAVMNVPNAIYTLNSVAIEFVGPSIGEYVIDEFKAI